MKGVIIALVCIAVGVLGGVLWYRSTQRINVATPQPAITYTPEELHEGWQDGVARIANAYDNDHDARKAKEALLALRVRAEDRDAHLKLVMAMSALEQGGEGAENLWQQALRAIQ